MISIVDGQILSMAFIESLASNFLFFYFGGGGGGSFKTNRIIQSFSFKGLSFLIFSIMIFFPQPTMFLAKT